MVYQRLTWIKINDPCNAVASISTLICSNDSQFYVLHSSRWTGTISCHVITVTVNGFGLLVCVWLILRQFYCSMEKQWNRDYTHVSSVPNRWDKWLCRILWISFVFSYSMPCDDIRSNPSTYLFLYTIWKKKMNNCLQNIFAIEVTIYD